MGAFYVPFLCVVCNYSKTFEWALNSSVILILVLCNRKGMDKLENIRKIVEDSECVLIGLGNGMKYMGENKEITQIFQRKVKQEKLEKETEWLLPFLKSYSCMEDEDKRLTNAYENLYRMVKNKNYFVVTLNEDDKIFQSGFAPDKITAPCGSMSRLQCINGCEQSIKEAQATVNEIINAVKEPDIKLVDIEKPCCEKCGGQLVFNTVEQEKYLENGYMKSWEKYRMWLTGTLNKKICLLELGTDFKYPSIIRWAFEKVAFINEKATFIRINEKYPQLTEELKGKAYAYNVNPIEFFQ